MQKPAKAPARLLAVLALIGALIALIVVVSSAPTDGDNEAVSGSGNHAAKAEPQKRQRSRAATYVIKSGDTLIAIAHKTGVPVNEIMALNPEIDPQILITGESLKLK